MLCSFIHSATQFFLGDFCYFTAVAYITGADPGLRKGGHKAIEAAKLLRIFCAKYRKTFDLYISQEALSLHFSCKL